MREKTTKEKLESEPEEPRQVGPVMTCLEDSPSTPPDSSGVTLVPLPSAEAPGKLARVTSSRRGGLHAPARSLDVGANEALFTARRPLAMLHPQQMKPKELNQPTGSHT